jgi:hypothetical protein
MREKRNVRSTVRVQTDATIDRPVHEAARRGNKDINTKVLANKVMLAFQQIVDKKRYRC